MNFRNDNYSQRDRPQKYIKLQFNIKSLIVVSLQLCVYHETQSDTEGFMAAEPVEIRYC